MDKVDPMILIVEDEAMSRRTLSTLLRATGYHTQAVRSAEDALTLMEGGNVPEVALVDLDLPGMSGAQLIERMEASNPSVRSVLITATNNEALERFRTDHHVPFLRKPLNFIDLLSILGNANHS